MDKRVYVIDGAKFSTFNEFVHYFSQTVLIDWQWNGSLDAFNDILRGGFGTPEDGFVLRWENSELSQQNLGYGTTAQWLREKIANVHPYNITAFQSRLSQIEQGQGVTLFDEIVEIIREHGVGGAQERSGVELELL